MILGIASVLMTVGWAPLVAGQINVVDVSLGFPYDETFDSSDGDWTVGMPEVQRPAPTSSWEWGAPTSGPGAAYSGSNVWATNLDGEYMDDDCGGLMSPSIDLTSASTASVSFQHWKHMEASSWSGSGYDGGLVFVTTDGGDTFDVVTPVGGYDDDLYSSARECLDGQPYGTDGFTGPGGSTPPAPDYSQVEVDLSAYAGQTVNVVLGFGSDGSVARDGWYVDDFTTTIEGSSTVEDFEAGDGGFSVVSTAVPPWGPTSWEHGTPSSGPGPVSPMWATNLDGDHNENVCAWIESPPLQLGDLPNATSPIVNTTLRWSQWYDTSSYSAGGVVQVGSDGEYHTIEPTTGYPDTSISSSVAECLGEVDGAFAGDLNDPGDPMVEYVADLTEFMGREVTIRFLFTAGTFEQAGWYIDNVNVEQSLEVNAPSPDGIIGGLPVPGSGGADAPGWSSGGQASSWAYGNVTEGPEAAEGTTNYATNLDGDHNAEECSWIASPAVPGALLSQDPTLIFDHTYRIAGAYADYAWGGGVVQVSTDGGSTWEYLDLPEYDRPQDDPILASCMQANGVPPEGMVFSGDHEDDYERVEVDLSDYASATTVQVRFLFGSDDTFEYEGWAIQNVEMGGLDLL